MNTNNGSLNDIFHTIRDTGGGVVKPVTQFTFDTPGWDEAYYYPNLAQLSGNRALLVWYQASDGNVYYAVLDSAGNTVRAETSTGSYGWRPDAVQLSDGKVVIAGSGSIEFVVLDSATYNVVAGPTSLYNPAALTGDDYVSVAADSAGHAILTWMDEDWDSRHNLYYALVDGNGNVLTDPMIFRASQATDPRIETSYEGYGNTSWAADTTPPTNPTSLTSDSHATGAWSTDDTVEVAWSGAADAESGLDGYSVVWDNAPATVPDTSKDLEDIAQSATSNPLADGDWYFHIRTVDNAGNWAGDAVHIGPFRIDTTAPESAARSPEYVFGSFQVTWSGSDAASGIASYDVEVRDGESGTWGTWLPGTTATSDTYTAVAAGHTYYFRSIAHDAAGNDETDLPADGDTHTTIAAYQVAGQVTNNRHQPVFNATVSAQPAGLNTAATDTAGEYTLYLDSSGTYTLTASRSGFGALPPLYGVAVDGDLSGVDFVLPPMDEGVTNGGWETGDLSGWNSGPGVTPTVETTATHTGRYGVGLEASGGTLAFWPYVTQSVPVPATWSQPTLSFLYRVVQSSPGDALLATVSTVSDTITHTVSLTPGEWTHTWRDLSAFSGQTVTLSFGFEEQTGTQQVYLDEISLGETRPGVLLIYLPLVLRNG